jgi:hypothetical protein
MRVPDAQLEALVRVVAEELRRQATPSRPLLEVARQLVTILERRGYPSRFVSELESAIRGVQTAEAS